VASLLVGSTYDDFFFLPVGNVNAHVLVIPRKTTEDAVGRIQAAVNTVVSKVNRCLRDIALRRTSVCLEMERISFEKFL
jgi:hypothetical protein